MESCDPSIVETLDDALGIAVFIGYPVRVSPVFPDGELWREGIAAEAAYAPNELKSSFERLKPLSPDGLMRIIRYVRLS